MSNPAIVVLTDPSRCGAGDVHHLVQALLEIQQMGEYATPQAFCDHPAAAKDFMAAYTHAYPKLVLESREIPTPDHLEALITAGQIGPLGRPPDLGSFDERWRPIDQNGLNPLPLVVLTLGNPQALIDALRQNHLMQESISLIDIVPDGANGIGPVSIAEAVGTRGLAEGPGEDTGPSAGPPALDEVASASATESADLVPRDDQIGLATVEPVDPPGSASHAYDGHGPRPLDEVAPSSLAAPPQPVVEAGQAAAAAGPQDGAGATPSAGAEPATVEAPAPAPPAWPADGGLIPTPSVPVAPIPVDVVQDDAVPDDGAPDDGDQEQPDGPHPDGPEPGRPSSPGAAGDGAGDGEGEGDGKGRPAARADAHDRDDDVHYPPVGSLNEGADVHYPAPDQVDAPATLRELALAMSEDGILDTGPNSEIPTEPQDDRDSDSASLQSILSHTSHDDVVTFDDLYASVDADTEDAGDTDPHHPLHHESDL